MKDILRAVQMDDPKYLLKFSETLSHVKYESFNMWLIRCRMIVAAAREAQASAKAFHLAVFNGKLGNTDWVQLLRDIKQAIKKLISRTKQSMADAEEIVRAKSEYNLTSTEQKSIFRKGNMGSGRGRG